MSQQAHMMVSVMMKTLSFVTLHVQTGATNEETVSCFQGHFDCLPKKTENHDSVQHPNGLSVSVGIFLVMSLVHWKA